MEGAVLPPRLDEFMRSALVTWVRTFVPLDGDMNFDFSVLLDGVFLNDVMTQINPSATPAKKVSRDPSQRTQNLNVLVQRIKTYYQDNLRQFIMIPLPNVLLLGRTPYCEQSPEEMNKLLMLLLGCAVQCEEKEEYIERIQTLDFETKAAIAAHIHEVTHSQEYVLDMQWFESSDVHPTDFEVAARNLATHLQRVLDQGDTHLETIAQLMQEKEGVVSLLNSPSSPQSGSYSPSMQQQTGTQQHLSVELADSKAKIRRLRQELEEKSEQMLDCRHELENMENSQLLVDARAARTYRDELDALRERAMKADKLESEVGRYREQLHKMEVCKAKVEELKEDNRVLQETKEVLEDQLEENRGLRESQEATKELLKLKDRLIEVERNNATLEAERQAMQAQLRQLENQSDSQQENNTALQTLNANLQVEKYTLYSQSASLMAQNAQLQQQQSGTESERDNATREREELRAVQEQLLRDNKLLEELHKWQTMDYAALIDKHDCLKKAHCALTLEYRTMQESYNSLLQQRTNLEDLEKDLKEEQMRMALEKEQNRTTAAECCRLRDEKDRLNLTYRQLVNDKESLTADHKELKSQLKGNLEEKSCLLLGQIETPMLQNRTLLEQTMESKDLFDVEERQYIDKLNDLRRQKERLEEKIMDQYKVYEPSPPRRRGNWFALKMKKLIKSNSHKHGPDRPPTPTHSGVAELHLSNSSIGADASGPRAPPQQDRTQFTSFSQDQEVRPASEAGPSGHSGVSSCRITSTARGKSDDSHSSYINT